jgi:uncharacterized protein YndB with AHSA1/START domain
MITTNVTVQIDRPIAEVFAFVTDPANFPRWAGALVKESRQTSPGPIGEGTTFTQANMLMGRRFVSEMRVVTYEPPHRFEYVTTSGPIRFAGHYTFAPSGDSSTKFTSIDESEPSGLLRYLQPLLQPFAQRQITSNLAQLKAVIEAQPDDRRWTIDDRR